MNFIIRRLLKLKGKMNKTTSNICGVIYAISFMAVALAFAYWLAFR